MSTVRRKTSSYDDGDHCKKAIYVFVYLAGHCVPGCVPDPAALAEKVHDRNGRMYHGHRLYAGGLRNLSSAAALPEHLGGKQPVLGPAVDVHELRLYQFYMDLALGLKRGASARMVAPDSGLVVLLSAITQTFAGEAVPIVIERTTGAYHGYMAVILFVGYLGLILYNMYQTDRAKRIRIPWLLAIGILVQSGWEAGLLIGGIRSAGFSDIG